MAETTQQHLSTSLRGERLLRKQTLKYIKEIGMIWEGVRDREGEREGEMEGGGTRREGEGQ